MYFGSTLLLLTLVTAYLDMFSVDSNTRSLALIERTFALPFFPATVSGGPPR